MKVDATSAQRLTAASEIARVRQHLIVHAREDPAVFAALVLINEETQQPVALTWDQPHSEWQRLVTDYARVIIEAVPGVGKSQAMIARIMWELGKDPTMRVVLGSATDPLAVKTVRTLKRYIETSETLHAIFPQLRPGFPWGETQFAVARPDGIRDPSVTAAGLGTNIHGIRAGLGILDDILTAENTATATRRMATLTWYYQMFLHRLNPDARVVIVANTFHAQDAVHLLSKTGMWMHRAYPVMRDDETLVFPKRWNHEAIAERKRELDALSPIEFERSMLCQVPDENDALFREEFIALGLQRGNGHALLSHLPNVPAGCTTWTGYDVASSEHEGSDLRAAVTLLRYPNGVMLPLAVESGRWKLREQLLKLVSHAQRYHSVLTVESNASQVFVIEQLQYEFPEVAVRGFNTNAANKRLGMHQLAADLAGGRFAIPNQDGKMEPEVASLISDLRGYRENTHTGDRLMALMIAAESSRCMGVDVPEVTMG